MGWVPQIVALTGANGMVGRHVSAALEREKISCVRSGRAEWDLRSWLGDDELDRMFGTSEAIIHAGAAVPSPGMPISDKDIFDANVRSCLCLGEWARKRAKLLIFLSGAIVYERPDKAGIREEDPVSTRSSSGQYGLSKLLGEQLLDSLAGCGLDLCVLRPSSVYGAGMSETRMIASMLGKAQRGDEIRLKPPVRDRINLLHAADLADAIVAALCAEARGVFNVAGPSTVSIAEIAAACIEIAESGNVILPADDDLKGTLKYDLDYGKASAAFGYVPRVCLKEGLRRSMLGQF